MNYFKFLLFVSAFSMAASATAQCVQGDCINGKGTFVYKSGAKYVGDFKNGEIHGIGVCYYSDGSKYSGEWKNRYPDGTGTKTYANGQKRNGKWKQGQPVDDSGAPISDPVVAKNEHSDGAAVQSGCISGDCENGQGVYAYPNGQKYEGQFKDKKPDGWGTLYYVDGDDKTKFIGTFREGLQNGNGTMFFRAGLEPKAGDWRDGEYRGNPIINNGRVGCISGDCNNGNGVYIFKNGSARYEGEFKNGKPHGKGVIVYANGERYVGEWAEGVFNGRGTLYRTDNTEAEGIWDYGTYMGKDEQDADTKEPGVEYPEVTEPHTDVKPTDTKPDNPVEVKPDPKSSEPVVTTPKEEKPVEVPVLPQMKVYALVVGVAAYNSMPVLRFTDDDAYRMYAFLKSPEGGALPDDQISVLIDESATKDAIISEMNRIFGKAGPNDLVMLYFSGHGLQGCFLPIDYDGFSNQLMHDEINAAFDRSKARYKLCIADACHSGGLLAMRGAEAEEAMKSYYATLANARPGTALILSSKAEENSLESNNLRQGVFSHFLLRGLKGEGDRDGNHVVTVNELYRFIYDNVRNYTANRQSPVMKGDFDPAMTISVIR